LGVLLGARAAKLTIGQRAKEQNAMASLKAVALALAVSLFGASMVTTTAQAARAPNKAAAQKQRTGDRNAYLVKRMTSHGISQAKARSVVASITRYENDYRRVHKHMSQARAKLHDRSTANDKVAQAQVDADKKQLERFRQRYKAELARTLTAGERAKVAQILAPPPKAKRKGKGKAAKKGKPKAKQKRT
jgi:hypothetical protein